MKTLYLVRHAKSDWSEPGRPDHERKLLPKGEKRTARIVEYLIRKEVKPDLILTSHAARALHTARLLAGGLSYPEKQIEINRRIYASDEEIILEVISEVDDSVQQLMVVGHNPEFTNLVNLFIESPIDWLPTTGVAAFTFETEHWNEISLAPRSTRFFIVPKSLK